MRKGGRGVEAENIRVRRRRLYLCWYFGVCSPGSGMMAVDSVRECWRERSVELKVERKRSEEGRQGKKENQTKTWKSDSTGRRKESILNEDLNCNLKRESSSLANEASVNKCSQRVQQLSRVYVSKSVSPSVPLSVFVRPLDTSGFQKSTSTIPYRLFGIHNRSKQINNRFRQSTPASPRHVQ